MFSQEAWPSFCSPVHAWLFWYVCYDILSLYFSEILYDFICMDVLPTCVSVHRVHALCHRNQKMSNPLELVTDHCELPCVCWDPLEELPVLFCWTTSPAYWLFIPRYVWFWIVWLWSILVYFSSCFLSLDLWNSSIYRLKPFVKFGKLHQTLFFI